MEPSMPDRFTIISRIPGKIIKAAPGAGNEAKEYLEFLNSYLESE